MFKYEFILENYTKSDTADRLKIDNSPDPLSIRCLLKLHSFLTEVAWYVTKVDFTITSAYRSQLLNDAVGGAKNSAHLHGLACDIIPDNPDNLRRLYSDIRDYGLDFDQLILYNTHIHVSIDSRMRRMAFAKIQHVDAEEAKDLHGY